jgi:hypothetical protein
MTRDFVSRDPVLERAGVPWGRSNTDQAVKDRYSASRNELRNGFYCGDEMSKQGNYFLELVC